MEANKEKKPLKVYKLTEDEFKFLAGFNQFLMNYRKHIEELSARFNGFLDYLIDKYEHE